MNRHNRSQARIEAVCNSSLLNGERVNTVQAEALGTDRTLWWRFSDPDLALAPASCNHALTALLPLAMHAGQDLHVRGAVDRTLLENLEELIDAWTRWRPDLFRRVRLSADTLLSEPEPPKAGAVLSEPEPPKAGAALMFSGGVDATYALLAHHSGMLGHRSRVIKAAVMVHGFDIPLSDETWFATAGHAALPVLDAFDCRLLEVKTNWREMSVDWEMGFGFGVTSVLHQLDGSFGSGLWAADEPYDREVIPWGSNSISNPLLSGVGFPVRAVGAGANRSEKIAALAGHQVIRDHVRVCWRHPDNGLNCGKCEKCVRTRLALLSHGAVDTRAFPGRLTPGMVADIKISNQAQFDMLEEVLSIRDSQLDSDLKAALVDRLNRFRRTKGSGRVSWIRRVMG